jgi:hypothetical protein
LGINVNDTLREGNDANIIGMLLNDFPCTRVSFQLEQFGEQAFMKECGRAERICIAAGDDWIIGVLVCYYYFV